MRNTYYLDSGQGNDGASGTSPEEAWKSLGRAMAQLLGPGDELLLRRGAVWNGSLTLKGSGERRRPITIGTYGQGPRPRLVSADYPIIRNEGPVSWWRVRGLELRGEAAFDPFGNPQGRQHGIHFSQDETSEGLSIEDCVIHDISGTGIVLSARRLGVTSSRGWSVSRCEVFNAGTGISTDGPWPPEGSLEELHACHAGFSVTDCLVHDTATDGIVLHYCQDGIIEGCKAWRTGMGRTSRTPVGIWLFLAARCVIQRCESFDNHAAGGHADGGGFDLDGGCVDCVMQHNYSHDNDGAGYLVCSYDPQNAPCVRCVVRFNLSVNDGRANDYASIQFWQADDCQVHHNTCVTRIASCLKFASDTMGNRFADNIFVVDSRYDIPLIHSPFSLAGNSFENNLYWSRGGRVFFKLANEPRVAFEERTAWFASRGERCEDPRLSALSGPCIHPLPGSPALGDGHRADIGAPAWIAPWT